VAAFAGLRRGELVSLRWRAIDFERRAIYVKESVSAGRNVRPKRGRGRTVPLAPELAEALEAWRLSDAQPDDLVFRNTHAIVLGLRPFRFHDLRHTFGSLAVDGGASLVRARVRPGLCSAPGRKSEDRSACDASERPMTVFR